MKTNDLGLNIIKESEGLELKSYICPAGILTIGYGHTGHDVKEDMLISEPEAEELLKRDCEKFENVVSSAVNISLTENQFSACVSLAYNIGGGVFSGSTLVKKLNSGKDFSEVAEEFPRWNKGGGQILPGLVKRRERERELFLTL